MFEVTSFIKWPLFAILGITSLYISVRVIGAAWWKSKQDAFKTQRKAFNEILAKATRKGVK